MSTHYPHKYSTNVSPIRIGPVDLTVGTLSPDSGSSIPTVTDNLFSQGTISSDSIGISFEPATSQSDENGELTWGKSSSKVFEELGNSSLVLGGVDSSKFTGSITFVLVGSPSPRISPSLNDCHAAQSPPRHPRATTGGLTKPSRTALVALPSCRPLLELSTLVCLNSPHHQ